MPSTAPHTRSTWTSIVVEDLLVKKYQGLKVLLLSCRHVVSKMKLLIFLTFCHLFDLTSSSGENHCYVQYSYAKVCKRYRFEGECQAWQLDKCVPVKVTHSDFHCPRFFCVSFLNFTILSFYMKSFNKDTSPPLGCTLLNNKPDILPTRYWKIEI